MLYRQFAFTVIPVIAFYAIYWRYFHFKPVITKHVQAFFLGISATLILLLLSPYINAVFHTESVIVKSFFHAALIEKIIAMILILAAFKNYPNFSIVEATLTGMMFALGFSAAENFFYSVNYGISHSIARIFFSVPMHLMTCGILANFLGQTVFTSSLYVKTTRYLYGFLISWLTHGLFDFLLLGANSNSLLIVPMMIALIFSLEVQLSHALLIPGYEVMKALKIEFEDWQIMWKQPRYERWISDSMGRESTVPVSLFIWKPGFLRFLMFIIFTVLTFTGFLYGNEILNLLKIRISEWDRILLLHVFPGSLALASVIVGSINPDFYRYREIKIPVMTDIVIKKDDENEDTYISYDMSYSNCFIRTYEELTVGNQLELTIEIPGFRPETVKGKVVWEQHIIGRSPSGTIIRITEKPKFFFFFIMRYYLFRIYKGTVFLLQLPGFEKIRKLFVHPTTTMQQDIFLSKDEILYSEDEPSSHFFLLKKGKIETFKIQDAGETIRTDIITEGTVFGEVSVVAGKKRSESARALEDSIIARADIQNFQALLRNNPDIAVQLYKSLSERIYNSEQILMDYITRLNRSSFEKQHILDSLSFLLLIIMGNSFDFHENGYDLSDIRRIISKMDDRVSAELAGILIMKKESENEEEEHFRKRILEKFRNFYKSLDMQHDNDADKINTDQ